MNLVHTYAWAYQKDLDRLDLGEIEDIYREMERSASKTLPEN